MKLEQNNVPKVSVIVPVYNAGNGLVRCLDSLLDQTLDGVEIILVCDCPTDGSDRLARKYASSHSNVVLLENERNLGIASSRNRAMDVAKGEYIGFSDHDDYMLPTMYERMYGIAKERNADVVAGNMYEDCGNECTLYEFPAAIDGVIDSETFVASLLSGRSTPVWHQLFRRTALNGLRFTDNVSFEDGLFNICFYLRKPVSVYVNEAFYHHVVHGKNTFSSYSYRDYIRTSGYLYAVLTALQEFGCRESFKAELAEGTFRRLYSCILNEYSKKGIVAAIKLCRFIKTEKDFMEILSFYKNMTANKLDYSLAKRAVLHYLCH